MLTPEKIAQICHEANRAYCMGIGDHSIPPWDHAPEWQKSSSIEGVKSALANPNLTPEQSHERWMEHKASQGWKYGALKRPEALEHPCMVSYAELPEEHRVKDALFLAVVRAVANLKMPKPGVAPSLPAADNAIATSEGELQTGEIETAVVPSKKKGKKSDAGGAE